MNTYEIVFEHHDLEEQVTTKACAVFEKSWTDTQICNAIRNGLTANGAMELDELDMDEDGTVERVGDKIIVTWTHSRGAQSQTIVQFPKD